MSGSIPGDHAQLGNAGEGVDQLFGQAVTEILLVGLGIEIRERQNGNGSAGRKGDWRFRRRCWPKFEYGLVGSFGKLDGQSVIFALAFVVGEEFGAQAAGFDADDGIQPGIVGCAAIEHLRADDDLFQSRAIALQGLFDRETQEARHALGVRKYGAGSDLGNRETHSFGVRVRLGWPRSLSGATRSRTSCFSSLMSGKRPASLRDQSNSPSTVMS